MVSWTLSYHSVLTVMDPVLETVQIPGSVDFSTQELEERPCFDSVSSCAFEESKLYIISVDRPETCLV